MVFFNLSISWSFFSNSYFSCSARGSLQEGQEEKRELGQIYISFSMNIFTYKLCQLMKDKLHSAGVMLVDLLHMYQQTNRCKGFKAKVDSGWHNFWNNWAKWSKKAKYSFTHRFMFCRGVDFMSVAVGILLTSLLLLDNPTDVILELIKKAILLPNSQCWVSHSGVLVGMRSVLQQEDTRSYIKFHPSKTLTLLLWP